jgi:hypothetical protein
MVAPELSHCIRVPRDVDQIIIRYVTHTSTETVNLSGYGIRCPRHMPCLPKRCHHVPFSSNFRHHLKADHADVGSSYLTFLSSFGVVIIVIVVVCFFVPRNQEKTDSTILDTSTRRTCSGDIFPSLSTNQSLKRMKFVAAALSMCLANAAAFM